MNKSPPSNIISSLPLINANFTTNGFSTVFANASLDNVATATKLAIYTLAEVVSDVKITRTQPNGFESTKDFRGIEYVGYIIEKERLDRNSGQWIRLEEIRIVGSQSDGFIDTRVLYGEVYRYRIKTILRITKQLATVSDNANTGQSAAELTAQRLRDIITSKLSLLQDVTNLDTEIFLFDNYYMSIKQDQIQIFQKIADQNNNLSIRSLQKSALTVPELLTGDINVYLPIVNNSLQTRTISYKSYYYESLPSRAWTYIDTYESEPPPAPENMQITPNTPNNSIMITWLKPSNSQRDIKAYRIYRRNKLGDKWAFLKEISELDVNSDGIPDAQVSASNTPGLYVDKDVNINDTYIYAMTCVDIHNIESFLSAQIQTQLNPKFILEKQEKPLKWISGSRSKTSRGGFCIQEVP